MTYIYIYKHIYLYYIYIYIYIYTITKTCKIELQVTCKEEPNGMAQINYFTITWEIEL